MTKAGTRPNVVATSAPPAKEQAYRGEFAGKFRRQHGKYQEENAKVSVDGKWEVARVSRDTEVAWVSRAIKDDKLTKSQGAAADKLAMILMRVYGSPSGRSSIDFEVRSNLSVTDATATARVELYEAQDAMDPFSYSVLIEVLWEDKPTGKREDTRRRWQAIVAGLDVCCRVWRIG